MCGVADSVNGNPILGTIFDKTVRFDKTVGGDRAHRSVVAEPIGVLTDVRWALSRLVADGRWRSVAS